MEFENEKYAINLKKAEYDLDTANKKLNNVNQLPKNINFTDESNNVDKHLTQKSFEKNIDRSNKNCNIKRVLILSDQLGYSLDSLFQNSIKGLLVQSIIKPNAMFAVVILKIKDLT